MKHYTFGGSTAARTIYCPAWIQRSADIPRSSGSSEAAREGSMLHEVMEQCRLEGLEPSNLLGYVYTEKETDYSLEFGSQGHHIELAEIAYNTLEKHLDDLEIDQFDIEPFVEIVKDKIGGSIDYLGLSEDGKTVLVADYKFGRSEVSAEANKQLLFYALGAMIDPRTKQFFAKAEKVVLSIIQPKVAGVLSSWSCDVKDLAVFKATYLKAVEQAESDNPIARPGGHCHFCPARPYCEDEKLGAVRAVLLDPKKTKDLEEALKLVDQVEEWAKTVKQEAHTQLERGVYIPGWKLVGKRATNQWKDEADAEKFLTGIVDKDQLYKVSKTFITAPQALTLVKRINKDGAKAAGDDFEPISIDDLIHKVAPKGTTLAPEDDPREAVVVAVTDNLKNLQGLT